MLYIYTHTHIYMHTHICIFLFWEFFRGWEKHFILCLHDKEKKNWMHRDITMTLNTEKQRKKKKI